MDFKHSSSLSLSGKTAILLEERLIGATIFLLALIDTVDFTADLTTVFICFLDNLNLETGEEIEFRFEFDTVVLFLAGSFAITKSVRITDNHFRIN